MSAPRTVLVTGASSGNGQATARLLSERGYRVFGTSRNPSSAGAISGVEMVSLDVCSDDSVAACARTVIDRAGHLDALVNNAGYELAGALEELTLEEAHAQFETNFFGVVRMVKAVLPAMRRQKSGRIVNISSLSGLAPIPFLGMYSASKFALEGYSEALQHELSPFGIQVSLVEAGFLKTPLREKRQVAAQQMREYDPWRVRALDAVREHEEKGPGPGLVASTVLDIIESRRPRMRYVIGRQAQSVSRLRRFLPAEMFQQGTRRTFRLDAKGMR